MRYGRTIGAALGALALLTGAGIAAFHTGVELHWWKGLAECGGTLAPLFTIGGGLGSVLGALAIIVLPHAGVDVRIAALVGMAAMFAGASRALLASVIFAFETTRQPIGLLPLLGGCAAAGLFRDCFGGPSWLIRRNALLSLCEEASDTSGDDVPALLAKLVLSGHRLEVIPVVLSQCVQSETQSNESSNNRSDMQAYEQVTPRELWPALRFARSLFAGQKQAGLSPNMSQVLSELVRLEHELRRFPRLYGAARQLFQQGVRVSRSVLGKKRGAGESTIGH